jgi:hypothetical protein
VRVWVQQGHSVSWPEATVGAGIGVGVMRVGVMRVGVMGVGVMRVGVMGVGVIRVLMRRKSARSI